MNQKLLIHTDRVPSFQSGTPTFFYAANIVDPYQVGVLSDGPLNETRRLGWQNRLLDEDGSLEIYFIPPWDSANRKPFDNMIAMMRWMDDHAFPINIVLDDLHFLKWVSGGLSNPAIKNPVNIFSNFQRPEHMWDSTVPAEFHFRPKYPFNTMKKYAEQKGWYANQPKYPLAYVGRFFPKRLTILKHLGFKKDELILLGPGWHKQELFPCAYAFDGGQPWAELVQMYREAQWHLIVQDKTQNSMWPAVSRVGECLISGRPLIFHESFVAGRPNLDWSSVRPWIAKTADDCRAIMKMDPEEAVKVQTNWAETWYYEDMDHK